MRRRPAVLAAALAALAAGCRGPKYARFVSPWGDFRCDAPWDWRVFEESSGADYATVTFAGPLDPDFYLGTPSLSVRWHAYGRLHRLPDGASESYRSAKDYLDRTLREVYGPGAVVLERERIAVAGREGLHLRLFSPVEVPSWRRFGVAVEDGSARPMNLRDHDYVVIPGRSGFYVIVYPATRQGRARYSDRFYRMVNTFAVLKDGPGGSVFSASRL